MERMHPPKTSPRRRCTVCRKWFLPAASAASTQRTCSQACRRVRQRKLARQRRKQDLHNYRVDERERQRASRQRQRESGRVPPPSPSRASLPAELRELKEELLTYWDVKVNQSRAALVRHLHRLLLRLARR
jgi:hypothetical protein